MMKNNSTREQGLGDMKNSYSPVPYVYRELIEEQRGNGGKIFFFDKDDKVDCLEGTVVGMEELPPDGLFVLMNPAARIRIDRVITVFGRPGPAFDEYDAFANACLSCTGGYDL